MLVDQNVTRRRRPRPGHVYAVNDNPLIGQDGGALHRVELSGRTFILNSDHPDKAAYPTRTFDITAATLPEVRDRRAFLTSTPVTPHLQHA